LKTDFLIIGAGFSGLTLAERLSNSCGASCMIVEKRADIGGNARDEYDRHGVLIHSYGPHYFRTDSSRVVEYLSRFTEWTPREFSILSYSGGRYWNFPINLNTFEQLLGRTSTGEEFEKWLLERRIPVENPANSEEFIVSRIGHQLYDQFFRNYTRKQWGREAKELDPSVCGRIPIRTDRNDRYLREKFQALPKEGYHSLFRRMLDASEGVELLTNTDFREVIDRIQHRHLIFTGPVDEYFDHCYGPLPYRSLRFEQEHFTRNQLQDTHREVIAGKACFWQPAVQVNYPNEEAFTRIVEMKHATGQHCAGTTIVREYPEEYSPGKEPYYPMPTAAARELHTKYARKAAQLPHVSFVGRLASYRYLNMDQTVAMALDEAERLADLYFPGRRTK
jgi:UDP-galactopyranose mutase